MPSRPLTAPRLVGLLLERMQPTGNLSAVIYGELITGATIAAALGSETSHLELILVVVTTLLIFWVAHGYSDLVDAGVSHGGHLYPPLIWATVRRESPMVAACLPPLLVLAIAGALGASDDLARYLALATIALSLVGYGTRAARRARLSLPMQILAAVVHAALGIGIISLKAVIH